MKLNLETRRRGDVFVVQCQGRIVYRDEAAAFALAVRDILVGGGRVVVDLAGVSCIDGAGIGELALLHSCARTQEGELRYAGPRPFVRLLLKLTQVGSFLEIHSDLSEAVAAMETQAAELCADC